MDFFCFENFVKNLSVKYFNLTVIGKSVQNKNIYAICTKNKSKKWAIITAGIHAREHLSTDLVCKMIQKYAKMCAEKCRIMSKNTKNSPKTCSFLPFNIAFVPQVNPDGADLAIHGTTGLLPELAKHIISINGSPDFSAYKANFNGVDLNNNFPANWHQKFTKTNVPASQGFYGKKPLSEPESKALYKFTKKLSPFITISYHLKGEEIYYDFFQKGTQKLRDQQIAKIFSLSTGYRIKSTQNCSSGGYKDWCVSSLEIPALTVELGDDKFAHPYPQNQLENIYKKNSKIFSCLLHSYLVYNKFDGKHSNKIHEKGSAPCTASIFGRRSANRCSHYKGRQSPF